MIFKIFLRRVICTSGPPYKHVKIVNQQKVVYRKIKKINLEAIDAFFKKTVMQNMCKL